MSGEDRKKETYERARPWVCRALLMAGPVAVLFFMADEAWKLVSFIGYMNEGEPFIYIHGEPHGLVLFLLAVSGLLALFGRTGKTAGGKKTGWWIAGLAGLPLLILLMPLLFGTGTIVTEELAKRHSYESCFWRTGAGSLRGGHLSWEVFYVPHNSECTRLSSYDKEKFFAGIASQAALAGRQRIPIRPR